MRFLNIPSLKPRTDLVLISAQKEDVNILMLSCLNTEEEIECPSASEPPGNRERGKEPGNFLWLPRLPWPKMVRLVCHTMPSKQCLRLSFSCRERSIISHFLSNERSIFLSNSPFLNPLATALIRIFSLLKLTIDSPFDSLMLKNGNYSGQLE